MPSTRNAISKKKTVIGLLFAGTLLLGACGGSDDEKTAAPKTTDAPKSTASTAPDASAASVAVRTTALGDVLVGTGGMTLYGFTNDADGTPTCNDDCAGTWPPLTIDGELPAGLDPAVFSLVDRADGTKQLKAGKWPLYYFSGDSVPGDTNGQGSGDVWFVVAPDGKLIKEAPPADSSDGSGSTTTTEDDGY